jgi:response regulator NasT
MAGEKYVVATADNSTQIAVRNILNPCGYSFLGNCNDSITLLRLVRTYNPDFVVADTAMQLRELKTTVETIDDEMLCACVVIGQYKDMELLQLLEKSKVTAFCQKPLNKDLLLQTVEMSIMNYRRVYDLNKKLKEMTENYETRKALERAKWILMNREGISENEAYERIRKKSMDTRTSVKTLAEAIILAYELGEKKK